MPLHIRKFANAFSRSAKATLGGAADNAVSRYKKKHGGLWVGGLVEATDQGISFFPNALNRSIHSNVGDRSVPMHEINSVAWRFGWLTGIVVVTHSRGELLFRCFNAKGVVRQLDEHLRQRPNHSVKGTSCGKPQAAPYLERWASQGDAECCEA